MVCAVFGPQMTWSPNIVAEITDNKCRKNAGQTCLNFSRRSLYGFHTFSGALLAGVKGRHAKKCGDTLFEPTRG